MVDIEDSRFYEHSGVDVQGTLRALVTNLAAGSVQEGGSTLTQQLVKQTLLQTADTPAEPQAATQQSVGRKLREARLAMGAGPEVLEGRDPHPVPEHRVLRRGLLRHRGRGAEVLQHRTPAT